MSLLALLQQKKAAIAASRKARTAKLADGRSRWRIYPSWRGEGQQFWHDFGQHFVKNAAGETQAIYVCTEKTFGKPCEVCSVVAQSIKGATDDATLKVLNDAKSNGRVLVNASRIDGPEPDKVEILELPPSVFADFVNLAEEHEKAGVSIMDLTGGKDIIVSRSGTGKNTKYSVMAAVAPTAISPSVMGKLHNLDEYVQQENAEGQTRALTSVRSVAGLLPAPGGVRSTGLPLAAAAAGAATISDDDMYATAPAPAAAAPKPAVAAAAVTDVLAKPTPAPTAASAVAAAPVAAAAPAAAAAVATGDDELDALLAGLPGGAG